MQEKAPDEAPTNPKPLKDLPSPSPSPIHSMQPLEPEGCELRRAKHLSKSESSLVEAAETTCDDEERDEDGEEEEKTDDEEVELYQDNETVQIMSDDEDCVMSPDKPQPVVEEPPANVYDFQDTLNMELYDSQVEHHEPYGTQHEPRFSPEPLETGEKTELGGLEAEVGSKEEEEQKESTFEKDQEDVNSDDEGGQHNGKTAYKVGGQHH